MATTISAPFGAPARYTSRLLPPYRHVPGLHPHPISDPHGHSYNPAGHHPLANPLLPPDQWRQSADYLFGVDLYNQAYWWEAHEAWEGLWQQSDKQGTQGRFLQGLIQISAAQLKRHMEQPEGVHRLLARAMGHLAPAQNESGHAVSYMGIMLKDFLTEVDAWFNRGSPVFPFIRLIPSLSAAS